MWWAETPSPAEDPATLYEAVGKLIAEPELRARLGAAARRYAVKHLGRDEVLGRFERDLLTLARRPLLQTRRASDVT